MKAKYLAIMTALVFASCTVGGGAARENSPANSGLAETALVNGTVKFEGSITRPAHINMSADPNCMKIHPAGLTADDIVADSDGGLRNVLVFVSEGLGDRTFDAPQQPVLIEQKGCVYQPRVVGVWANQRIEVVNRDTTAHNIHPIPHNNPEWNKLEPPGSSLEVSFPRAEIAIPVKCNVHPWMQSYIAVFKNPYFAVTGNNGSFELGNLPPGEYTVKAWHEKLGTATQRITISATETKRVSFVFKAQAAR